MQRFGRATLVLFLFGCVALAPARAYAQADEIQVYDGGLAPKGIFNQGPTDVRGEQSVGTKPPQHYG